FASCRHPGYSPAPRSFPTRRSSDLDTAPDWEAVEALLAVDQPLLDYVRHCGSLVKDVLSGRVSALETLFPGGSFDVAVRLYHERSEEHTSELQSRENLVCRLLLEKK